MVFAGMFLVGRQRRKIAAENDRIAKLDRKVADDDPDDDGSPTSV